MKRQSIMIAVVAIIFLTLGGFVGLKRLAPQKPADAVVAKLFTETLPDANGQPQALAQWQGKPLLINFWATWCGPCVKEMPELSALQTELAPKGIQFIGIGIDSASSIQEFSAKHKISYPLYVAGMSGTELSSRLGNQAGGLPFTVLISADGQIRKTYLGALKMTELRTDLAAI
ncbi:MAG: TlpA disulfide reductase family protein [Pseudomonadota bacterium]